jgi:hypothetical protein
MKEDYSAWVGRSETTVDVLEPARTNALRPALGETRSLTAGDAMPPVPLPRHMWAGGTGQIPQAIADWRVRDPNVNHSQVRDEER